MPDRIHMSDYDRAMIERIVTALEDLVKLLTGKDGSKEMLTEKSPEKGEGDA